jgi:hypothetical protein
MSASPKNQFIKACKELDATFFGALIGLKIGPFVKLAPGEKLTSVLIDAGVIAPTGEIHKEKFPYFAFCEGWEDKLDDLTFKTPAAKQVALTPSAKQDASAYRHSARDDDDSSAHSVEYDDNIDLSSIGSNGLSAIRRGLINNDRHFTSFTSAAVMYIAGVSLIKGSRVRIVGGDVIVYLKEHGVIEDSGDKDRPYRVKPTELIDDSETSFPSLPETTSKASAPKTPAPKTHAPKAAAPKAAAPKAAGGSTSESFDRAQFAAFCEFKKLMEGGR